MPIELPHLYRARPYQIPFWEAMDSGDGKGLKRAVLVWHRRAGKEKTCWNYMIQRATQMPGNYYYIFPDSKMARRILWDGVDKEGLRSLDHIPKALMKGNLNNVEMKFRIHATGGDSIIQLVGAHDPASLRGTNPIGVVFSEYAEQSPEAYQIVSPILKENGGWAVFNFTPKGQNHAKELFDMAAHSESWFCEKLTVEDTSAISREEIDTERREGRMSEDMIQQEYYCSFTLGIEGSYYAKAVEVARLDKRIGNVPYDRASRVHTAWDIGYGDSTAIIFFQIVGQEVHIIDFYENHGEGLPHYVQLLQDKRYIYGSHYAPHDIESHSFANGLSPKQVAASLGINFITLATLRTRIEDGVEAVRAIFPRLWFDHAKTHHLIKAAQNYRKTFDPRLNVYSSRPVHDWSSHAADALRYLAMAVRMFVDKIGDDMDDRRDKRLYETNNPLFF